MGSVTVRQLIAPMVITATIRMPVLPTDITALTGFTTDCLLAPGHGTAGVGRGAGAAGDGEVEAGGMVMAAATAMAEVLATVMAMALPDAASPDVDSLVVVDSVAAAASTEVAEDSTAEVVVVGSTVAEAVVTGNRG